MPEPATITASITLVDYPAGTTILYRLAEPPAGDGYGYDCSTQTSDASDDAGLIEIDVLQGGVYQFWINEGSPRTTLVVADDAVSVDIPRLVSRKTP